MSKLALFSPAELNYIHSSLSLNPPIRPDGRSATQFRPLVAEADVLPNANGSARVCFSDGGEAVVGVKAEVEKSATQTTRDDDADATMGNDGDNDEQGEVSAAIKGRGKNSWMEISVDVPGYREDDALPVFLSQVLSEALTASGTLRDRLWINNRFHWKLYVDILLLSPPLSYPLPLLSLTMHLALLSTRLPRLISEGDEDPLFDDDWEASGYLYPYRKGSKSRVDRPPITLLVITVGENVIFDPSKEEVAAAEGIVAVSASELPSSTSSQTPETNAAAAGGGVLLDAGTSKPAIRQLQLLALRTVDPPARSTPLGIPNVLNSTTGGAAPVSTVDALAQREGMNVEGVWTPPRGGVKRAMIARIIKATVESGGVGVHISYYMEIQHLDQLLVLRHDYECTQMPLWLCQPWGDCGSRRRF